MIKMAIRLTLYGLIALLMPFLVHAEEIETKEETKIEQKEDISIVKSVNPDDPTESCTNFEYTFMENRSSVNGYLSSTGTILNDSYWVVSNYTKVTANKNYYLYSQWSVPNYCLYDLTYNLISCTQYTNSTMTITPTQNGYIRYSIRAYDNNNNVFFKGENCVNMEEETMIKTQNIEKLLIIGVGLLFAIFLTRRN